MKKLIAMILAITFATFISSPTQAMPPKKAVTKVEKANEISPQVVSDVSPQIAVMVAENNLANTKDKMLVAINFYDKALTAEDASPGATVQNQINIGANTMATNESPQQSENLNLTNTTAAANMAIPDTSPHDMQNCVLTSGRSMDKPTPNPLK